MEKNAHGSIKYCKACGKKNFLEATFCMMCGKEEFFKPFNDFEMERTTLVHYRGKGGDVLIPDTVTSIGDGAFFGCRSLTRVVISNGVTDIGKEAFAYCSELISAVIPNSVTRISADAFCECERLTEIKYAGTKEEWRKIEIESDDGDEYDLWDKAMENGLICCLDGTINVSR